MRSWGQEEKEADRMKQPQLGKEQMLARREGEREKGGDGRLVTQKMLYRFRCGREVK